MIFFVIIFVILFYFLAWRRLDWAVMFLIAALPSYLIRFSIFGLPLTLLEVMIWAVFLVWLVKNYRFIFESLKFKIKNSFKIQNSKFKIIRNPFDWEIVLMLLIALTAAGVAGFSSSSLGIWKAYFFEPALFFIAVLNVMVGTKGREKILWSLAVSALAVSALTVYQKITGQLIDNPLWAAAETRRAVSFFGYPNAVGLYLGPLVAVMMGWLSDTIKNFQFSIFNYSKIFKTFFISLVITLSILSVYFAKSKGALVGVAAGLIVFGLLAGKKIRWATIAVILIVAASILAYRPVRQLAYQTITFKTLSGQIRLAGWRDSWKMLADGRLITGAGLANYQKAAAPYHQPGMFFNKDNDPDFRRKIVLFNDEYKKKFWQPLEIYLYPHNIILNFWSELGLAGLLLFIWIIAKYFYLGIFNFQFSIFKQFSMNKFLNISLICAMVVIIVHGIVDVPYFKNDLAVMFWLLIAMMGIINLENKYEKF